MADSRLQLNSAGAAGASLLSSVDWNQRNLMIFAISLSVGLGLQLEPGALQHLSGAVKMLMTSVLLPAAALAIILNLLLLERVEQSLSQK